MKEYFIDVYMISSGASNKQSRYFMENLEKQLSDKTFYRSSIANSSIKHSLPLFFTNYEEELRALKPRIILILGDTTYSTLKNKYKWKDDSVEKMFKFIIKKREDTYYVPLLKFETLTSMTNNSIDNFIEQLVEFLNELMKGE